MEVVTIGDDGVINDGFAEGLPAISDIEKLLNRSNDDVVR